MDVGISGCQMDFQGWNRDLYHCVVGNKILLASVVQEPVGWELGCLCINALSYFSYFKPVPLGLFEKKVIIKLNAKRFLGLLRGDCIAASHSSSPGTQSLCF